MFELGLIVWRVDQDVGTSEFDCLMALDAFCWLTSRAFIFIGLAVDVGSFTTIKTWVPSDLTPPTTSSRDVSLFFAIDIILLRHRAKTPTSLGYAGHHTLLDFDNDYGARWQRYSSTMPWSCRILSLRLDHDDALVAEDLCTSYILMVVGAVLTRCDRVVVPSLVNSTFSMCLIEADTAARLVERDSGSIQTHGQPWDKSDSS
ncbi:hypothetical protein BDZ89DRAFT_1050019 [Hymenopellis radicata]|nr:hypothetical protein BDZ89DRAFT_1050019 [Hymenopellis radicata]